MRLICMWCCIVGAAFAQAPDDRFYAPQTFKNHVGSNGGLFAPNSQIWTALGRIPNRIESYQQGLFKPASDEFTARSGGGNSWKNDLPWKPPAVTSGQLNPGPATFAPIIKSTDPWRPSLTPTKEQQAAILHHKQALSSEGNFRFEYASDNGLAAGEIIQPDGTRLGAYQYKDPSGQIVKLKYKAGKEGFQILEGSHVPKSVEPAAPPRAESHYQQAYEEQRRQFELQQTHNRLRPQQQWGGQNQGYSNDMGDTRPAGGQYFVQNLQGKGKEDDGQYRENDLEEDQNNKGPHSFGEGYAFSFEG